MRGRTDHEWVLRMGPAVLFVVLLGAFPVAALAGDGTFTAEKPHVGAGEVPYAIAIGDFDADGNPDLAVADFYSDIVSIRLGVGDATFTFDTPDVRVGDEPIALAAGDLNGDGKEDLAVANQNANDVSIRLGVGDGSFTVDKPDVPVGRFPQTIAIGDLNADGREDLAVANDGDDDVSIRLGAGNGLFTVDKPDVPIFGGGAHAIAVGDLNADGKEDLAVTTGDDDVSIQLGMGDGTFTDKPNVGVNSSPFAIAVGDLNADGREDLAVANFGADDVSIRLGVGDGTFTRKPTVDVGSLPRTIAMGDLNTDGKPDLAVANYADDDVSIRLGTGDGTFVDKPDVGVGDVPFAIAVGDLDSDGNDDLAVTNSNDGDVSIRLGAGAPPLAGSLLQNGGFEGASAVADPTISPPPPIPGWERTGMMTAARYGMRYSSIFPGHLDSPRFAGGGLNFLFGGPGTGPGTTTAFQTIDVSGSAEPIDAGFASARLSAYLGGGSVFDDHMGAAATFLDAGGTELGSFSISPVTAANRNKLSTMLFRAASAPVPAGTRQIRVTLTATNLDAGGASAFADNVKLTLDAPGTPEGEGEDIARDTVVELALTAKKKQRVLKQKGVIIGVECPLEACAVAATGTARLSRPVKLKPASKELVAGVSVSLRLKLKRKQLASLRTVLAEGRKPKLRVSVEAVDAAGNRSFRTLTVRTR